MSRAPALLAWVLKRVFKVEVAVAIVGLVAGFVGYLWWTHDPLATLDEFVGKTERDTKRTLGHFQKASVQDEFFEGDGARTQMGAEAKFSLPGSARLILREGSLVRFQKRAGRSGALGLTVELGHVDVFSEEESFSIGDVFGDLILKPRSKLGLTRRGKRLGVAVTMGRVELLGSDGSRVLEAGQSIELEIGGVIVEDSRPKETRPGSAGGVDPEQAASALSGADIVVGLGESFTVHDPSPPTRLGFHSPDCTGTFQVALDGAPHEGPSVISVPVGRHRYLASCTFPIASWEGRVEVQRDAGTRPLPSVAARAEVRSDGRKYTVSYQIHLPDVVVTWPSAPPAPNYTLVWDGQAIPLSRPETVLRAPRVRPGIHTFTYIAHSEPERRSRTTTLALQPDPTPVEGQVREPRDDFDVSQKVNIRGQALPGWTVSLDGTKLELDAVRRFALEAQPKGTLAVEFSHPERGRHYYLRRPRLAPSDAHK